MRSHVKRTRILASRSTTAAVVTAVAVVASVVAILTDHSARGQEASAVAANVRIAAQRLDNGVVRFGLHVRYGSGGWSEQAVPRAHRFDPANTSTGSWLVSSPLTLEIDDTGRARVVRSDQFEPSPGDEAELVSGLEGWSGDTRYSAYHDEEGDLVTSVSMYSASVGAPDGELRTTITCRDGEISIGIGGLPSDIGEGAPTQPVHATWSVDNGTSRSEPLAVTTTPTGLGLEPSAGSRLADALLGTGSRLTLEIRGTAVLATTINLSELRTLPVYSNLRHCAGYAVQSGRTELRIRARVRADDRIEFAIQQRTGGDWGEGILPRARIMPAYGGATDWLSSTPVSVRVELDPPQGIILPDTVVRQAPEPITPVLRRGFRTDSLFYDVYVADSKGYDPTRLTSIVAAAHERGPQLQIACFGDERRVLLAAAPSNATGGLILTFDDTQLIARWNVSRSGDFASLSPTDSDRAIQRLLQARSLSIGFEDGGVDPISFDLTDLFATPIQANIDQCGNYAAPEWQPLTAELFVQNDTGEYYTVRYSEGNDPLRASQVRVNAIDGRPAPGVSRITLVMTCSFQSLKFNIWGLPEVGQPSSIGLQIDGGEWYREPVSLTPKADGSLTAEFNTALGPLKQGRTLQFDIGLDQPIRGAFDLTNLLGTPIQTNFDNCGRDYWAPARTFVPVVTAEEQSSRDLSYVGHLNGDGTVTTVIHLSNADISGVDGTFMMQATCIVSAAFQMHVGIPLSVESDEIDVTVTIDDRPADTSTWIATTSGTRAYLHPPSNARLMAELRRASVVIVEAPGLFSVPITFHVRGMFDTPVQGNLDECGYYKPGEVRTPQLPLNAYDTHRMYDAERDLSVIRFWERIPGVITPSTLTIEQHYGDDGLVIGLSMFCGGFGGRLSIYGPGARVRLGDQVHVEWRTDNGPTQRAIWNVIRSGASNSVSPPQARAIIAMWRSASELEVKLFGDSPDTHRFDLDTMFGIPVIETFDACMDTPIPNRNPPITGIPATTSGELTFAADFLHGSAWLSSYVRVPDSGEASAQPDARDTRSSLLIACSADGPGLWVEGLDAAESTMIYGDSVDVTWTIDGRKQDETWSAWTQLFVFAIAPMDSMAFYEALKGARTLTIRVASDPPLSKTYELAKHGFWDTPVQPNLDACGAEAASNPFQ